MKEMIKSMVQEMVMQSIKEVMAEMMGGATTTVANAVVEEAPKKEKLTKEDYKAMLEEAKATPSKSIDNSTLDIEEGASYRGKMTVKFNQFTTHDIWVVNHLALKTKYGAKWSGKAWYFDDKVTALTVLSGYEVIKDITPDLKNMVAEYDKEQARKKAEYYSKKASEYTSK